MRPLCRRRERSSKHVITRHTDPVSNPDLPPDSITTLPYAERTAEIRRRFEAFAYSGETCDDRERDTVVGHLLDQLEQFHPESWPRDKPMPPYLWGDDRGQPHYRQALREYWEANGLPARGHADSAMVNEAVEWWNARAKTQRERLVHDDPELAAQIREGVAQAERGETVDLGDFAQYLDEGDDDE
jgi:hypothetical protein